MRQRPQASIEFEQALAQWEKTVDVPTLAGEIEAWCQEALTELESVQAIFGRNLDGHEAEYSQILKADMGLAPRVEELRAQDGQLRRKLEDVRAMLRRYASRGSRPARTSEEPVAEAGALRESILDFIVHCRAHEAELQTWLVESFYRDRGEGD